MYRNSEIGDSDSDFSTRYHNVFFDDFPTEICGIPEAEAEIPIPEPPARCVVPAEFTTKLKEEHQKHIMNMYQTPVESYRSHLIPLALARAIHFIFEH
jgi:hypothetical protein